MELLKNKNSRMGLIGTMLFHGLLLILFLLYGLTIPVPIPEQSIVINFGTSKDGAGKIQPEETNAAPKNVSQVQPDVPKPNPNPVKTNAEAVTQDNVETVSVNDKKTKTKDPEPEPVKEPEKTVNKQAMFPGKSNTSKNSSSEGETGKPGDQGDPGGDRNSSSHVGNYSGGGDSYNLGLRKANVKVKPKLDCQESGRVVVRIWVDRNGNTVNVQAGDRGTTNPAACLLRLAEDAARKTKWEADPNAPDQQVGTIAYNFVLN
jgi:periplasmic protein TonB